VERTFTLHLAPFAVDSLDQEAQRQGIPLRALLRHAALYYLGERSSGRLAARVPTFARAEAGAAGGEAVAVVLDASERQRVESAALIEGVSVEALMHHAAVLYVADCESGRVASRLLDAFAR
jgi:hypothetical protein